MNARLIIGRDQMNGFSGLSDGDVFKDLEGKFWILKPNSNLYWTLYETLDGHTAEYSKPHPRFTGVQSYFDFIWKVNEIWGENN